jgi:integrase
MRGGFNMSVVSATLKFVEGKAENTRKTYLSLAKSLESFLTENGLSLEEATPLHFKTWITSFPTANSKASAKRFLCALLKFLGYHEQLNSLKSLLREIKPDFSRFRVDLTLQEVLSLIEACPPTQYKFAVSLMAFNGLRVSEVLGLYWEDIDVKRRLITLRKREGETYGAKGMTPLDKPITIPLNPISHKLFLQLYSESGNHEGRILPISYKTFLKWFYRYTEGVLNKPYRITPHKLRHFFAHLWLTRRGSLVKLKAMLRHKRLETTMIYAEPSEAELSHEFRRIWKAITA